MVIFVYYTFIESWTLGYSFFSLTGKLADFHDQKAMKRFLTSYQGLGAQGSIAAAYVFFLITFGVNTMVLYYGIRGGIERL